LPRNRLPLLLWLASAPLIFSLIFASAVERSQEARVLETAREMIGQGWENWLIPHCNGQVRLRKPPLAYWAAAASFKIFGVHDWTGRIPFALASWLLLAATYAACRPIIGQRGALLASAGLAGTCFFIRFGRYAETDILAALFVTTAIAGIIHGALAGRSWVKTLCYLAAGVSIGLVVMSKGPPAIFPVPFLIGFAWILGRWQILSRFLLSGAFLAAVAVALPWWLYVSRLPEFKIVAREITAVTMGLDHPGPPWFYFLVSLLATAPWCAFVVLGITQAIRRCRRDLRARIILLWIACIIVPMSLVVKKQDHYMLSLLPPFMAVAGWAIDQGFRARPNMVRWNLITFAATAIGGIVASAIPIFDARQTRKSLIPADFVLAASILIAGSLLFIAIQRSRRQMLPLRTILSAFAVGSILMVIAIGHWRPSLEPITYPDVARQIQGEFGHRELVLYDAENLPICFYLGRTLPYYETRVELLNALSRRPNLAIIWEQQEKFDLPPPGIEKRRIPMRKRDIVIFEQK
jgi:4-amino-4-deoxy-L-arabinose transferase-like glycosyltransferase